MKPLAAWWHQFVTANGVAFTLCRLALASIVTLLFFPFGTAIIVALWALGIPVAPGMPLRANELEPNAPNVLKLAAWVFFISLIAPTLAGAAVHLLSAAQVIALRDACLALADMSLLPSSLGQWAAKYANEPLRGAKYALTSVMIVWTISLLLAEFVRRLAPLVSIQLRRANAAPAAKIKSANFTGALMCFVGPFLFFSGNIKYLHNGLMPNPDVQLTGYAFPVTLVPVFVLLVGAYGLWGLIVLMRHVRSMT
jgi:hypothetical protein